MDFNAAERLMLWIAIFAIGWVIYMQLEIMFPTLSDTALGIFRSGMFVLNILSFVKIIGSAGQAVEGL